MFPPSSNKRNGPLNLKRRDLSIKWNKSLEYMSLQKKVFNIALVINSSSEQNDI